MKKVALSALALLTLAGVVTGCGSQGQGTQKETISFWFPIDPNVPEGQTLKQMVSSFEKKYPNINVQLNLITPSNYETKIRTALAGGTAPDVMAVDAPTVATYASEGALIPLDKYMKQNGNENDILAPELKAMTYQGHIYASPQNDSSLAMFYNIKMFKSKGIPLPSKDPNNAWTWQQVLSAAQKLNNPSQGVYGWQPFPWGFMTHEGVPYSEMPFLWQAGASILSPDGKTAKGYLDSPQAKQALTFWGDLFNKYKVSPKDTSEDAFPNGKVAIDVDGPWYIAYMKSKYPNFKLGVDYGVAPLWKGVNQVTPDGSWNIGITSQSKHPADAWKLVNWITGVQGSKTWYKETSNLPARKSTIQAFSDLQSYPMDIFAVQSEKFAHPRPVTPAYPTISDSIRALFEDVALKQENVNTAVEQAVNNIDTALQQSQK